MFGFRSVVVLVVIALLLFLQTDRQLTVCKEIRKVRSYEEILTRIERIQIP